MLPALNDLAEGKGGFHQRLLFALERKYILEKAGMRSS